MFEFIIRPLKFIMAVINFVICLMAYIKSVFVWTGKTMSVGIMFSLSLPVCFWFYILHVVWIFFQFVIFDVLLTAILLPSQIVGKALGYPLKYKYDAKTKKKFKDNTSLMTFYDNYAPAIMKTCYSFASIGPFPEWDLKIPEI